MREFLPKLSLGMLNPTETTSAVKPATSGRPSAIGLLAATLFLSAFLLFQVQLIISKYILPWFGGTPSVWTTSMLFFQVLLLAGYAYAHWISIGLSPAAQAKVHVSLVIISVLLLLVAASFWPSPITPGASFKPQDVNHPVLDIMALLGASVALPFFLLSTTGPLLQSWYARTENRRSPYRLYAVSNFGSLLGLISYPFLVEPLLKLRTQARIWTVAYFLFAAGCAVCAIHARNAVDRETAPEPQADNDIDAGPPTPAQYLLWVGLAACACMMLLAATNVISQELVAIPLLWVIPLALYLLSFILCFESERWYKRGIFHAVFGISLALVPLAIQRRGHLMLHLGVLLLAMFAVCMMCHGELARMKPKSRYLTSFYMAISVGGALGGIFVALIAPHVFPDFWELQISLFATALLVLFVVARDRDSWLNRGSFPLLVSIVVTAFAVFYLETRLDPVGRQITSESHFFPLMGLFCVPLLLGAFVFRDPARLGWRGGKWWTACMVVVLALAAFLHARIVAQLQTSYVTQSRNFFGVVSTYFGENKLYLVLQHGATAHGAQFRDVMAMYPTTYYGPNSGIGLLLQSHLNVGGSRRQPIRMGIIGLGWARWQPTLVPATTCGFTRSIRP